MKPIVDSIVKSGFSFKSYSITRFNVSTTEDNWKDYLDYLNSTNPKTAEWLINLSILQPRYSSSRKVYICGIQCDVAMNIGLEETETTQLLSLNSEIKGVFESDGQFKPEVEEMLVKVQMPAILMPYLRGCITTFLATAGYGPIIFPLINVNREAARDLKDIPVEIID